MKFLLRKLFHGEGIVCEIFCRVSVWIFEIKIAPHDTYGYDIYDDNHKLIHQPSIPGLPGNDGFKTKADALKVAQLVCDKLKNGEMPPSVSLKEMKQLKVRIK